MPSRIPNPSRPERHPGLRLPFWGLQAAELLIALALVDIAVHLDHGLLLLLAAGALGLLALSARGPLGVVRVCPPRAHVVLCVIVAALVLAALVVPALRPGAAGIATLVLAMLGLLRLATLTRTDGSQLPRGVWPAQVIDASATMAGNDDIARAPRRPPVPTAPGPPVQGPGSVPPAPPASSDGSTTDRIARLAGEAVATGQKAARRHRPALEAGARRGIRSLGRAVGRMGR